MNSAQKKLLDTTIGVVGWLCVASGGGLALMILAIGFATDNSGLLKELLRYKDMGQFVWTVLPIGIALLWIRAFIRAGSSEEQKR